MQQSRLSDDACDTKELKSTYIRTRRRGASRLYTRTIRSSALNLSRILVMPTLERIVNHHQTCHEVTLQSIRSSRGSVPGLEARKGRNGRDRRRSRFWTINFIGLRVTIMFSSIIIIYITKSQFKFQYILLIGGHVQFSLAQNIDAAERRKARYISCIYRRLDVPILYDVDVIYSFEFVYMTGINKARQ